MISTLDFSTAAADVLSMELDTISFTDMTMGDELALTITVYDGDSTTELDEWYNVYYADRNGKILIPDLARVWNSYIVHRRRASGAEDTAPATLMGGIKVKIAYTYSETTAECYRRIWYSTKRDGMTIATLNTRFPMVNLVKKIFSDSNERVYVAGPTAKTVTVTATYLQGSTVGTISYTVPASAHDSFGYYRAISPSGVVTNCPMNTTLLEYRVSMTGGSQCRFIIERGNYAQRSEFCYVNRWGVYETLWLVGPETWKPERNAEFGWAGDEWVGLDVDVQDTYEASTGYINDTVLEQLRDLSSSPTVWKWMPSENLWKRISVTSVDFEKTLPSNEVRSGKITYQYADSNY